MAGLNNSLFSCMQNLTVFSVFWSIFLAFRSAKPMESVLVYTEVINNL